MRTPGRFFPVLGPPTIKPEGYRTPDVVIDILNHEVYSYTGTSWNKEPDFFGIGSPGPQGPKGDKGDPGPIGPQGPPGSGSGSVAGIVVPPTQDAAGLQWAMNNSIGKAIFLYGNYNIDRGIDYKLNPDFTLYGNQAMVQTSNNNQFSAFYNSTPITTFQQAEALAGKKGATVRDLNLTIGSNQVGLDMTCMTATVEHCVISGGAIGVRTNFCMASYLRNIQVNGAKIGIYSGEALAGSQETTSNLQYILNCGMHSCTDVGLWMYKPYTTEVNGLTVQGEGSINYAFLWDGESKTTNKNGKISRIHFEQKGGANKAIVGLKLRDQTFIVDQLTTHYDGLFVEATAQAGQASIVFSHCNAYIDDGKRLGQLQGDGSRKYFSSNGPSWLMDSNRSFNIADPRKYFKTNNSNGFKIGNGYDSWSEVIVNRPF